MKNKKVKRSRSQPAVIVKEHKEVGIKEHKEVVVKEHKEVVENQSPTMSKSSGETMKTGSSRNSSQGRGRKMSGRERKEYYERMSQPIVRRTKVPTGSQRNASASVGLALVDMTPDQIAHSERKAIRDKKIEKMWMAGIRPETHDPNKPDFDLNFTQDEGHEHDSKAHPKPTKHVSRRQNNREQITQELATKEVITKSQKELDKKWLNGLRPALQKGDEHWNHTTDIARDASPDRLFRSDDDDY